jgi:hypothetical protein
VIAAERQIAKRYDSFGLAVVGSFSPVIAWTRFDRQLQIVLMQRMGSTHREVVFTDERVQSLR